MSQHWGDPGQQPWGQQSQQPWGQQWGQPQFGQPGNQWGPQQQPWAGTTQTQQQHPGGQPGWAPPGPQKKPGGVRRILFIAGGLVVAAVLGLVIWHLAQPQYRNDDYEIPPASTDVPDLPISDDPAAWEANMRQNPIYEQTLDTPVRCAVDPERLGPNAAPQQVENYLQQQIDCLYRVWGPALDRTGKYTTHVPTVTVYTDTITTACGTESKEPNAFYCSQDQRLYFSMDLFNDPLLSAVAQHPGTDFVIAHEYAHLLQDRIQVLASAWQWGATQSVYTDLEYSRRVELQADCLAGMHLAAVARSRGYGEAEIVVVMEVTRQMGEAAEQGPQPSTHGNTTTRPYWVQMGMSTTEVGRCNTFVVPPDLVR